MKLKEIKPGMVIHCKNDEEKKALLEEAERLGYVWYDIKMKPTKIPTSNIYNTIHFYDANKQNEFTADYKHITQSEQTGEDVIEFSDLILPELTAEEVWNGLGDVEDDEIYEYFQQSCLFATRDELILRADWKDLVAIVEKHIADRKKKEPEIEWVYRVFGAENFGEKFFNTEEEAIKRCEELVKSQKTKQYARYERVCRVKEVE